MITIIPVKNTESEYERNDFYKSLNAHASPEAKYEIVTDGVISPDSKIQIALPDNCLVLGNSWDKYVNYALDRGGNIDEEFVKRRFGLVSRPDNGIFLGLAIAYVHREVN